MSDKIETIRMLAEDEGWFDWEIGQHMNLHRVTVTRLRKQHNIPRVLANREDKKQVCKRCGRVDYIRRKQRVQGNCKACKEEIHEERKKLKRERYYREKEATLQDIDGSESQNSIKETISIKEQKSIEEKKLMESYYLSERKKLEEETEHLRNRPQK